MESSHLAAIPYPGRGHVNPMMALCGFLAARGLLVTVVVTDEWRQLLSSQAPRPNLRLHAIPDVLPSEKTRGNDPRGFVMAVLSKMEGPIEAAVGRLDPPVTAVLTDSLLLWAAAIASRKNVPVWSLWTHSATVFRALYDFGKLDAAGQLPAVTPAKGDDDSLVYLPRPLTPHFSDLTNTFNLLELRTFVSCFSWFLRSQGLLFTTSYELEDQTIDTLRSEIQVPIYTFGPRIPYKANDYFGATIPDYIKWLDSQPISSVLYISLGSFLPISGPQIEELGVGLHESGVRFLWIFHGEPECMKRMSSSAGLVMSWCDQLRVLCHPSVGGFLTHSGWNSTLEGVFSGIPMLTFPLIWDQYPNSKSIVDDWKIGLRLKEEERVVGREKIERLVKKLMDLDDEESKGLRKRSAELKSKCQKALDEGGSLATNLDALVQEIISKKSSTSGISS